MKKITLKTMENNRSLQRLGRILLVVSVLLLLALPFIVGVMHDVMPEMVGFISGIAKMGIIYIPLHEPSGCSGSHRGIEAWSF